LDIKQMVNEHQCSDCCFSTAMIGGTAQHSTAQHSTAQHSTAQHSTAQRSTAQHHYHCQRAAGTDQQILLPHVQHHMAVYVYEMLTQRWQQQVKLQYGRGKKHAEEKDHRFTASWVRTFCTVGDNESFRANLAATPARAVKYL